MMDYRPAISGLLVAGLLALGACTNAPGSLRAQLPPNARYVAMGSSYAAGAGIGPLVAGSPRRCGRTTNNYAHLLAARMQLDLVDASCGGAMTTHILGAWSELPAQIEAVTADARLVTVTIGGNDLNYVRNLMIASCGKAAGMTPLPGQACPAPVWPSEADFATLEQHMHQIAQEVRRRAAQSRLVFVEYLHVLPERGGCAGLPLDDGAKDAFRKTLDRLAAITARVAAAEHATVIAAGRLSRGHEACAAQPWAAGFPGKPAAWHPTAAGHAAIADILFERLIRP